MYELSRIRLHSIGPKGARYQDVQLDLRDVGAPIARPTPRALFDLGRAGLVRRPSPASVLFAPNGDGKSVLVKLVFGVILPGRRQIVGSSNAKALEDFVLATDIAHIALEWQHVTTGQVIVTGKVAAWRGHVVSADSNKFAEAWYSLHPTPEYNLDWLPFTEDGRLVSMRGFRERLGEADKAQPQLQVVWEDKSHRAWTEHLDSLGLDPELFVYQRRMNAKEGDAGDIDRFNSDEAFIDWLLRVVTEPEDPRSLAEVLDGYAVNLAARGALIAERDFVAGTLERLGPLARAARDALAAVAISGEAIRAARAFAAQIAVRHAHEAGLLSGLRDRHKVSKDLEDAADRERRSLNAAVLELRRHVAGLRLQEAIEIRDTLTNEHDRATGVLTAWQATPILLRYRDDHTRAELARGAVMEAETEAAPILVLRDRAAQALVAGLLATATRADTTAKEAQTEADGWGAKAKTSDREATTQSRQAERETARANAAQERITDAGRAVDAAVADGAVYPDQDPADAAARATETASHAARQVIDADADKTRLAGARTVATNALREADGNKITAKHNADTAEESLDTATGIATTLAAEDRLSALLGTDTVMLDTDAPALLTRLGEAITDAEDEHTREAMAQAADQYVLDALGTGGLLPPPADVTAVRTLLADSGITCYAGWEYLAQMPETERDRALTAHPHLVDGVVLNNPAHLDRARDLLTEARLLPRSVVAVGTTSGLVDLGADAPHGTGFLVPPNPAMYDEDRAETERQTLATAQAARTLRIIALTDQAETDRRLAVRLRTFTETYPPGSIDLLATIARDTAQILTDATEARRIAYDRATEIAELERDLDVRLPGLRAAEKTAAALATRLAALAAQTAQVPGWTETMREAREAAAQCETTAGEMTEQADRYRELAGEAIRRRDDQKRIATACRDEVALTPGGTSADPDQPAPAEPVESLRGAYRAAVQAYERVQVGNDLRNDLDQAEKAEANARAALEALDPPVRERASAMLDTPDGADGPGRAAAADRAARETAALDEQRIAAERRVGALEHAYDALIPQDRTLEPYGTPRDIAHGETLIARANDDWRTATGKYEGLHDETERIAGRVTDTERTVTAFETIADKMADVSPSEDPADPDWIDPEQVTAYPGSTDEARTRHDSVRGSLTDAQTLLAEADAEVRHTGNALNRYATDERFDQVDSLVRRQILAVDLDDRPGYAADWEMALRPRLRTLIDDLAQIERHRGGIISRLRGMVEQALVTLRAAERLSTLPPTLLGWENQKFLKIFLGEADPVTLNDRLGAVVDATAESRTRGRNDPGRRDGMTLLLKGVHAALPHGVRVEILKPDTTMRADRYRVDKVTDVFSGGQLLTTSIILYCTLAALRANERGQQRRPHAGVLFLDNPIGESNANYLLDMQLGVANALGVQLIYTTGLFDANALSEFPLIIKLRNDRDLRTGMKYLTVADEIRAVLDDTRSDPDTDHPGQPGDYGRITAARLFRTPAPVGTAAPVGAADSGP
jgi:hypothetical protein